MCGCLVHCSLVPYSIMSKARISEQTPQYSGRSVKIVGLVVTCYYWPNRDSVKTGET